MTDQTAPSDFAKRLNTLSKDDIKVLEASDSRLRFVSGRKRRLRIPIVAVLGIWAAITMWLINLELYLVIVIGAVWLAIGILIGSIKSRQILVEMDRDQDLIRTERITRTGQKHSRVDRALSDASGFQFRVPLLRPSALRLSFHREFPVTLVDRAPRATQRELKAWIGDFLGL